MSTPNPLDVRNLGALLGMLGNYQQGNYGFGPETNFAFPLLGGYGVQPPGGSSPPPPQIGNPGASQGGILPGTGPGQNFPGGPVGIPQGGGVGPGVGGGPIDIVIDGPISSVGGSPGTPGTPASGGVDWGDVGQAAGLGMGLLGPYGAALGAIPIVTADPYHPGTPGTPATPGNEFITVGGDSPYAAEFGAGAMPGPDGTIAPESIQLTNAGALTPAGTAVATDAVNQVLAQLPPAQAAQVVMAIQSGTDPVDAMRGVAIMGNAPSGWQSMQGNYGTYTDPVTGQTYTVPMSSLDALDAIGQANLGVDGGGQALIFGAKWRDHLGIGGNSRYPRAD